ncbi:MAG TPA: xylulokinase [Vicinamibacterales bacterium]|nr:xylulokinase [Vicinamibacterales bacterium]HPW19996.1 xylulokinase [Vicinamibacterales bacterium]
MGKCFIGIDSGTQSTKAVLVDGGTGRVIAAASNAYDILPSAVPGAKEQDPADWVRAASAAIESVLREAAPEARSVAAIGISGQQHGFVPLDAEGQVIRPAKLWCDTSTAPQCETLLARLGGPAGAIEKLGNTIAAGFTASKILWLKEHEPENFSRLATVLLPHDYLAYWLTGRAHMEWGDASGTALMDVRTRAWRAEALEAIDADLASKLPRLAPSIEPVGTVQPSVAARFGLGPSVFVSGSGDNMMGAVGTGNVSDGIVTASLGTSGTVYACSDAPIVDPNGEVAAFCDATGRWLPLACTMNVTVATEMVRTMFGLDHAGLSAAAAAAPPGSEGLLLVPFFEGERTPNVPDGTGVWIGVRPRTSGPAHMARAAMEGVTLGLNYGLNRLRELGLAPREIRLTGGGSKSAVWRQIAADVFGCSVVCPASEEGAAYGAALHAMWVWHHATGSPRPIADIAQQFVALDETTRAMPDARTAAVYLEMQALFDRSARDLGGVFAAHRRLLTRGRV